MLRTILEEVKAKGFEVIQIIMNHDTAGGNIACGVFLRPQLPIVGITLRKAFTMN